VQWFMRDANLPQYYNENDRSLWPTVRPTPLISVLLLQVLVSFPSVGHVTHSTAPPPLTPPGPW
jgi:hypothetical protein